MSALPIWLPPAKSAWGLTPLKRLCTIETGTADTQDADPTGEFDFVIRSPHLKRAATFTFDCEAIVTAGDGAVGEVFHHLTGKFLAHQRTYVLHEFRGVNVRYLYYYFSSHFRFMCQDGSAKTTVDSVRRWMLTDMPVYVPPADEQYRIAQYLDVETAKIDHLIAKQRKLIDLVEARETARRNQVLDAVIGTPVRLKWLLSPSRTRASGSEEVLSVYRDYGVIRKNSRTDNFNRTPEDLSNYLLVRPGDLVVNKMKAWQGSLGVSEFHGIVSGDYEVLRVSNKQVDLRFLHFLLRSRRLVNEYAIRSKGIRPSQWRLYWQELSEIEIPLPPISTQKAVAESVANTKDDRTILTACEQMIGLLQERRSALITAAVTGQIEV